MSVELGVNKIVPVETSRCIAKISDDKKGNKLLRLQAIAESASKQSKRNLIPQVCPALTLKNALSIMQEQDVLIVPYENKEGMSATTTTLSKITKGAKVGVVIGPEGGFSPQEIELLESIGANTISLGKRILRTETAAVVALSTLMIYAESNL